MAGPDNNSFPLTAPTDQCGEWTPSPASRFLAKKHAKASEDTTSAEG
jgi:hypothetical protein